MVSLTEIFFTPSLGEEESAVDRDGLIVSVQATQGLPTCWARFWTVNGEDSNPALQFVFLFVLTSHLNYWSRNIMIAHEPYPPHPK